MRYPDFSKPFDIYTDASDTQLGGVITQDGWPIAFYSRKINSVQINYTTIEKELLSAVEISQEYRHMLLGSQCRFYCDHKNLGFNNFRSERVRRWRSTLEEFDYVFKYHPGKDNEIADMLSRYPMTRVDPDILEEVMAIDIEDLFSVNLKKIAASQKKEPSLLKKLKTPKNYDFQNIENRDVITRKGKIILTEETFLRILEWYHTNLCHPGQNRTFSTLNSTYYFPNMEARVREYIDDCQVCKKNKVHSQKYGELPLSEMQADPWEIIQIDLFGPWTFIDKDGIDRKIRGLSIIDVATHWPELRAYSSK